MRWGLLVGAALCALGTAISTAHAGPTRRVEIVSDPAGATVYINDVDSGAACQPTPCTIDAPIGTTNIIVRKDGFNPEIFELTVPKKGKIKPPPVTLSASVATLVITDNAFKGGKILVDGVEKGTAPQRLEVAATAHSVQVIVKGKPVADEMIDLDAGDEKEIKPSAVTTATAPDSGSGSGGSGGGDGSDDDTGSGSGPIVIEKPATPTGARGPYVAVGANMEIGFRQFAYDHAQNGLSPTESEVGQVMIGPAVEIWPLASGRHLRGLSVFGKIGFGVNHQAILDSMNLPVGPTTFWGNLELDLRQRWAIGEASSIAIDAGFVRDQMQFNAATTTDLAKVPVVDYRSLRLGVRAATTLGRLHPFVAVEGRVVMSGGALATRFTRADITGAHASFGAQLDAGPVFFRAQGALTYYGWTFTNSGLAAGAPMADGATDVVEVLSFVIGLTH
jgi:hypothetical protein